MKERITNEAFAEAANSLGVEVAAIKAVAEVESRGAGFLPDGRPVILFERHKFHRFTQGLFSADHPDISNPKAGGYGRPGAPQWDRYDKAYALDPVAAMKSASYGKFQIMGFNYEAAGFRSVHDFVEAMNVSEDEQLKAFVNFVKANGLADELKRKDWAGFARGYNGADYKKNAYDTKMAAAYRKHSKARVEPETPAEAPEPEQPKDVVKVVSQTETPSGAVTTDTKTVQMTQTSPTAKKLTISALVTAAIGFVQQAWQASQETTITGIQLLMKHMPMVLLILGALLFAYWIWKKAQDSRDDRLKMVVDIHADKTKNDVVIT